MTLIRMIAHEHGEETLIQYYNELWPNDPNFTIQLFLHLFCSLQKEPSKKSWVLFEFEPQNAFFQ
jgi:hypothetical protein